MTEDHTGRGTAGSVPSRRVAPQNETNNTKGKSR